VARKVLGCVLAFAKGHVCRLHEDSGSKSAGMFEVRMGVVDPDQDRMGCLSLAWRYAISSHVSDYHRPIAKLKLRPMIFTNPNALFEPERVGQPNDCRSNIWIGQNGNHLYVRY
jgi:hypothetical protein